MFTLATILARAGSKGLPRKATRAICGRPLICYTFDHARSSRLIHDIVVTTDDDQVAALARHAGLMVVARPPELATDTATVDSAMRHAVQEYEASMGRRVDIVALLYGNVPVRAEHIVDQAIQTLIETGADSVRSVAPVTHQHPDWLLRMHDGRLTKFRENDIYRRQDLEPLYYHDGAVLAVTRESLFREPAHEHDYHAFLGADRRGIVQGPDEAVDVDTEGDLRIAEAFIRMRGAAAPHCTGGIPRAVTATPVA